MSRVVARGIRMWTATAGLRPIDLDVASGELVVVRGRSGSGKSTLLALLAGLTPPDGGTIEIDGRAPVADEPWSRIAMVPQVLALAIELSVRENVTDALVAPMMSPSMSCCSSSGWPTRRGARSPRSRWVSNSAPRSPGRSPPTRCWCSPTSRRASRTVATQRRSSLALRREAERGAAVVIATHDVAVVAAADRVLDLSPD